MQKNVWLKVLCLCLIGALVFTILLNRLERNEIEQGIELIEMLRQAEEANNKWLAELPSPPKKVIKPSQYRKQAITRCREWLDQMRQDPSIYKQNMEFIMFECHSFNLRLEEIGTTLEELEDLKARSVRTVPKKGAREI